MIMKALMPEPSVGHMIKVHNPKFKSTSNKINKYLLKVYACLAQPQVFFSWPVECFISDHAKWEVQSGWGKAKI